MQEFLARSQELLTGYLPTLLLALVVLVVGWLAALAISGLVRSILKRTAVDHRIAAWATGGKKEEAPNIEALVARIVFWLLMIFVLVAFFSILGLSPVTEPLNQFLEEVFVFLPRLLSAVVLVLVAWIVATGLRFAVRKSLAATRLDQRLAAEVGPEQGRTPPSQMVGESVYWLVFLLFLPAILDALALEGLLGPVNQLLNKVLAFLPNLFVALIILAVGWLVARVAQRVVSSLLAAIGTDSFGERLGLHRVLGERRLSSLLSLVVYVLVLVPVVIATLEALKIDAVTAPASRMLESLLAAVPRIFAAGLVLFVAYLLARLVSDLVARLLKGIGFDSALARLGFSRAAEVARPDAPEPQATRVQQPSDLVGLVVMAAVMLFAVIEALRLLEFEMLAELVTDFTLFAANVLVGVLIFGLGLYLANLAANAIHGSGTANAGVLAMLSRVAILGLAGAMALRQAGLAEDIINLAFGLLVGSVAVAAAIAFGIGGRELAGRYLDDWSRRLSDSR